MRTGSIWRLGSAGQSSPAVERSVKTTVLREWIMVKRLCVVLVLLVGTLCAQQTGGGQGTSGGSVTATTNPNPYDYSTTHAATVGNGGTESILCTAY